MDGIYLHQTKQTNELPKKFDLKEYKSILKSMNHTYNLRRDETNSKVYKYMIQYLLYLITYRFDILFSVRLCLQFQSDPREYHLIVVKIIFRCLK